MKNIKLSYLILISSITLIIVFVFLKTDFLTKNIAKPPESLKNFDECVAKGYPVQESYPKSCRSPFGQSFTEDIGNGLEKINLIKVDEPRPNSQLKNKIKIFGLARGGWFFEASFPIVLVDNNNQEIAKAIAQAQNDWMTNDFVPFSAEISITSGYTGKAKLILKKDNPSDDPANDDQLIIPVTILK